MNKLFQSRISLPGVAAGIAVSLSANTLLLSFLVALGIWSYRPADLPTLGQGFWMVSSGIWILSIFIGALVGSLISGAMNRGSLTLGAIIIWAGSYLLFGGLLPSMAEVNSIAFEQIPHEYMWIGLAGDSFSLLSGIAAAFVAYRIHFPEPQRKRIEREDSFTFKTPVPT